MQSIALLFSVLWSPGETMFKVVKSPRTAVAPILLLTVAGFIFTSIMFSHIDMKEVTLRALEQSSFTQQMSPEQKRQIADASGGTGPRVRAEIFSAIGPTLTVAFVALIYFGLLSLVGRDGGYKAFFAVTAFAFVPLIVRQLAGAITLMVVPQSSLMLDEIGSISPSIFMDRATVSKGLFAFVNQLDVVSIWIIALLVIGFKFVVTRRVSAMTRVACVAGVWLVWVALRVAFSSVFPT